MSCVHEHQESDDHWLCAGGKQLSSQSVDASSEELSIYEEFNGILFDGTDDHFVVRSEHELHLLQHAITTTRFKMASKVKAVTSTSNVSDPIKSMKTTGPASLDLQRFMLLAVGGAAHIHSVLLRTDGSMPVVIVKWQYNKKATHDRAYHAVKVPLHDGTVLFEHHRPRRTSLKAQPDIAAPWRQEADFAAGRVLPSGASGLAPQPIIEQRPSEYNFFEQRPLDTPPTMFSTAGGSGNETPTAASGPASQAVAQAATQRPLMVQRPSEYAVMEQRPSEYSFAVEQRPSDDFSALQQRGKVGSMPPLQEKPHSRERPSRK